MAALEILLRLLRKQQAFSQVILFMQHVRYAQPDAFLLMLHFFLNHPVDSRAWLLHLLKPNLKGMQTSLTTSSNPTDLHCWGGAEIAKVY